MPRANRGQAYSVSIIMNIVRMEQMRARARWRPAPIDYRRTLAFIACAAAMFAIFFEVGHVTRGTPAASSPGTYSPRPLSSASVHAGIPAGVVISAPLPASSAFRTPPPPPPPAHHASAAHHAAAAAPVAAAPVASAPVARAPAATPAPAAPVTPAPVHHSPAPAPSQPSSESSGGGGGGSFDSSE
jgi:hypothetical protein